MPTLDLDAELDVEPIAVRISPDELQVDLEDGRTISAPLSWYPRLHHGTPAERTRFELSPCGIHWPDLDEDISVRGLLLGRKSGEGPGSLKFWLDERANGHKTTLEDYVKYRRRQKLRGRKNANRRSLKNNRKRIK